MTNDQTLLPCPFCGCGNAQMKEGSTFRWRVMECTDCGARCGEVRVQTMGEGTPKDWEVQVAREAIAEWNKRKAVEPSVPCTCKSKLDDDCPGCQAFMAKFSAAWNARHEPKPQVVVEEEEPKPPAGKPCARCGGTMPWCSTCQTWTQTCCIDYGTCQCS